MENERLEKLKLKLLKNPKFRKAYFSADLASEIGERIFNARVMSGWSQEKLAKKIGTKQPSIARMERGTVVQTLVMLQKIADALQMKLELPSFDPGAATYSKMTLAELLKGSIDKETKISMSTKESVENATREVFLT